MLGLAVAALLAAAAPARAATVIDTTPAWEGFPVCNFGGNGADATFGQVITAPERDRSLDRFTVFVRDAFFPTTLVFRGEVYAWDGVKATGPKLWESPPRELTLEAHLSVFFDPVTFPTGGVRLKAAKQYVLFVSTSRDFEKLVDPAFGCLGLLQHDGYSGGQFVALNNGTDESQWTTVPWSPLSDGPTWDLAFTASFTKP